MIIVTATDLPRLMACGGSQEMIRSVPVIDRSGDNTVQKEGDAAHWLVREVCTGRFTVEELIDRRAPNGIYIGLEMVEHLSDYMALVYGSTVEFDTSFSGTTYQVNGRADSVVYDELNRTLIVPDLKYGWGIVEPEENYTLIAHAIGWLNRYSGQYGVDWIEFRIYQPRPYHPLGTVRTWRISITQLYEYAAKIDYVLSNPSNTLTTSKQCSKCPALAFCPAAQAAQMNAIEASSAVFVSEMDNATLSYQLDHVARTLQVLGDMQDAYQELATDRLKQGGTVVNYALEKGMSNYKWPDHFTPELLQGLTGKDLRKKDLVTPAQAIKQGVSKEFVESVRTRHETSTKLVRVDANKKASKIFN